MSCLTVVHDSNGNHVKFARFVLLAVREEAKTRLYFFSIQCIIKQLLDSIFAISRIIEVSVKGYQTRLGIVRK